RRLGTLVGELLDLSKLSAAPRLELKPAPLRPLIEASVERHQPQARDGSRQLLWRAPERLPDALIDADWLPLVLDNLISNGLKFTRPGGKVEVSAEERDGELRLCVADDGVGIAPEDQERLFQRFFRGGSAKQTAAPGTGLGLAIARE